MDLDSNRGIRLFAAEHLLSIWCICDTPWRPRDRRILIQ
jgi:hypothetical protein